MEASNGEERNEEPKDEDTEVTGEEEALDTKAKDPDSRSAHT